MHLNAKITAIIISVQLIYSCYASDTIQRTVDKVGKTSHQSTRPPEKGGASTSDQSTNKIQKTGSSSSSYAMLSKAMTEAVHHEFSSKCFETSTVWLSPGFVFCFSFHLTTFLVNFIIFFLNFKLIHVAQQEQNLGYFTCFPRKSFV